MTDLQHFFTTAQINPQFITSLLQEAIALEKLKLEIYRATNSDCIECHIKILQGEEFISHLTVASIS
jgi:hypothetical protein